MTGELARLYIARLPSIMRDIQDSYAGLTDPVAKRELAASVRTLQGLWLDAHTVVTALPTKADSFPRQEEP